MVQRRYELSDEQWNKIKSYFEKKKRKTLQKLAKHRKRNGVDIEKRRLLA